MSENDMVTHETHDVFESYDLADEDQIIAEMSGRVTDKYVYTFKQGGQDVTGLSFAGTNWAVREYAKQGEVIRVVGRPEIIPDPADPEYIIVLVTAQRFAVNKETGKEVPLDNTVQGKRQWRFMEKKKYENGEVVGYEKIIDPFFLEKGLSKAVRNSKQALIPTDIVKRMISRALDSKNGKNTAPVQRGTQGRPQNQPPQGPQNQPQQPQQPPQQPKPPQAAQTAVQPPPAQQSPPAPPAQAQAKPMANSIPPAAAAAVPVVTQPAQPAQPVPPTVQPQAEVPVQAPPQAIPAPAAPPPPPAAAPQEMPKDIMVQKLDAVLKVVFATQDTAVARQGLQRITGFASPADMPAEQIRALGNTLNSVVKKLAKIEGNKVIRIADNFLLWEGPQTVTVADDGAMF